MCAIFGDCGVQGEVLFFQKIIYNLYVQEASNNLVTEIPLGALLRTESRFSLVLVGTQENPRTFLLIGLVYESYSVLQIRLFDIVRTVRWP